LAGNEVVPENIELMSERRHHPEAGDNHAAVYPIVCHKNQTGQLAEFSRNCPDVINPQLFLMFFDVFDYIADGQEFFCLFVRHFDAGIPLPAP